MSERNKQLESEDPVIKIENLSFKYPMGDGFALEDINFSVKQGEFLGILGPSGAGKTTLCMILKGLIPYTVTGKLTGKVYFENVQLNK